MAGSVRCGGTNGAERYAVAANGREAGPPEHGTHLAGRLGASEAQRWRTPGPARTLMAAPSVLADVLVPESRVTLYELAHQRDARLRAERHDLHAT